MTGDPNAGAGDRRRAYWAATARTAPFVCLPGWRRVRPAVLLVRPDGHIGYRGNGLDIGGLDSYLDRWLSVQSREQPGRCPMCSC